MKIGIIGAGNIGTALAEKLAKLGHSVALANSRGPDTLKDLASKIGVRAVTVEEAVREVELVVVTIPQKNVPDLPRGLFAKVPSSVIVVDTGNYYPSLRDGDIPEMSSGALTESGWVAKQLGRPVFKLFNNIAAQSLAEGGRPRGASDRFALPVAGDDPKGKAVLIELVDALGFDGVDGGTLDESWRQEPGTPVYCTDLDAERVRKGLALADRSKSHERRDLTIAEMMKTPGGWSSEERTRRARELQHAPG